MEQRLATIVFIDMQGYTKRSAAQTVEEMKRFHDEFHGFVKDHLDRHGGVLVKSLGDGFLARFDAPTKAVACALEMQQKLKARNEDILNPDKIVRFRIGVNTGEIGIDETGDVFGDPVNIAARIQGFAEPNGVFISEATYLAMNRNEFGAQDLGMQQFKNATREIKVYKVLPRAEAAVAAAQARAEARAAPRPGGSFKRKVAIGLAILLALFVVSRIARAIRLKKMNQAAIEQSERARKGIPADAPVPPRNAPPSAPAAAAPPAPATPAAPAVPAGEDDPLEGLLPPGPDDGHAAPPENARELMTTLDGVRALARAGKFAEALAVLEDLEAKSGDLLAQRPLAAKRFYTAKANLLEKAGRVKEAAEARAKAGTDGTAGRERPSRPFLRRRPGGGE